jgi:hypothetical protein
MGTRTPVFATSGLPGVISTRAPRRYTMGATRASSGVPNGD